MPSTRKRKAATADDHQVEENAKRRFAEVDQQQPATSEEPIQTAAAQLSAADAAAKSALERRERFKALQARAKTSAQANLKEAAAEQHRLSQDPTALTALRRKHDIASQKLLKADTELAGEDFERKRAWDWTIEESEKWDRRMDKKQRNRDNVAFQDYTQEANKVYKRQVREMGPDLEAYEKRKMEAMQKAAVSGGLEVVETDDGEIVAVDREGRFYSTADSTDFIENRPDKKAVDRLVDGLQKAEDARMRKRRERGREEEQGDVTYINEKNKQFNQKLSRFYNKYTSEIRDSFERGTAL